jgi:hypothetical protein
MKSKFGMYLIGGTAIATCGLAGLVWAQQPVLAPPPAPPGVGAPSPSPGSLPYAIQQLPQFKGTVARYTLTPRGDVDGFILTDGTEVKVPKHLSAQLVYAIRPGDAVTVRGLKAFALPLIDAATITNDATGAVVIDNGPPGPDRGGLVTTITGKVLATLHGPRGDVNGAILENGTILRLGPREAASQFALLQPGQSLAARGVSTTTLLGTVMEVEAIGASPDQLVEVGPGGPGRGPGPRPDDRGPPPPPR